MEPTRKVIPGFGPTARASYSEEAILARIAIGTGAVAGKPLIRDTNIPVEHLVRLLAQGTSRAEIVEIYPQLETEDISAALLYTASLLAKTEKLLLPTP